MMKGFKINARPVVILQLMGPVMFVFDVTDTDTCPDAKPLPPEVEKPFEIRRGQIRGKWERTIENAKRDGVRIQPRKEGSQSGGSIRPANISVHAIMKVVGLIEEMGRDKMKPRD
jgi:hypothetical protein